jgi:DNA-binding transcriptional LysR family regulator
MHHLRRRIAPNGPLIASVIERQRGAAVDGLGIAYSFDEFSRTAVERGELTPVLEGWWQSFSGPFWYYPSHTHMPRPLHAFVDFILAANG